jgi:hypothetical protein
VEHDGHKDRLPEGRSRSGSARIPLLVNEKARRAGINCLHGMIQRRPTGTRVALAF